MDAALVFTGLGALASHVYESAINRLNTTQQHELDYTSRQIEELYGPLLGLVSSQMRIFKLMVESYTELKYPEDMPAIIEIVHKDEALRAEYVRWMQVTLLPLHRKGAELVETKSLLFVGNAMTEYALDYVAMVKSYEVIEHKWDANDFTTLFSPIRYPQGFFAHVIETFTRLKDQQQRLLTEHNDPMVLSFQKGVNSLTKRNVLAILLVSLCLSLAVASLLYRASPGCFDKVW